MMRRKNKSPRFEAGSYGDRAASFFTDAYEWEEVTEQELQQSQRFTRSVTWARWPYRYWLEQSAEQSRNFYKRSTLTHRMFQVVLLSASRTSDGLRELERWYIVQPEEPPERIFNTQHLVDTPAAERINGEMSKDIEFVLENGLYVPNHEDLSKLGAILTQGYMDGFEPVHKVDEI